MSGRFLARNTLLNLVGQAAPVAAAVVAIPLLIAGIGTDRFAVLTLAWILIGYFSLFDMGLSRALTHVVAHRLGSGAREELPDLIRTALAVMTAMGVAGGALLAALSPWLVRGVLDVPDALQAEALHSFLLVALALPFVISTGGLRGVLEAYGRFDLVNAIRVPTGLFSYLGPLLAIPFSRSLTAVIGVLVAGRLVTWAAHHVACLRAIPEMRRRGRIRLPLVVPLLRFGGWMTVSNVVSPLMTYVDRFVIGALLPVAAVAYYVTPYELATKLWILPAAITGVVFPALTAAVAQDRDRAGTLFETGVRWVVLVVFPAVLVLSAFAPEGLTLWLDADFAANSTSVFRWLAAGVLLNSVGQVAGVAVQAAGRPDLSAKLHCVEFPFYMAALWVLIHTMGLPGVAIAWTLRVGVDAVVLLAMGDRLVGSGWRVSRRAAGLLVPATGVLAAMALLEGPAARLALLVGAALVLGGLAWHSVLTPGERVRVTTAMRTRRIPVSVS